MNYSHDNWSAILAHIGKPEELDTSARNAGALTAAAKFVMLQLCYVWGWLTAPGGCHYVKSLHGLSSMTLQHYLTWLS
ncbi:Predicted divalent heavy-metal cations transporter [Escherichia coli]|nr:Predicted divalent heavy-metal cations transporter [Escherichia coli]